jgi:glycosyltransferase involved in cell wall biosynthesis
MSSPRERSNVLVMAAQASLPSVHVGLNLVFLVPGESGGFEVYARQLLPRLVAAAPAGWRFTAFVGEEAAGGDFGMEEVVVPVRASNRVEWVRGEQQHLPRLARRAGCDLVHSLASTAPLWGRFKRVVTIHDLIYRRFPEAHLGWKARGMALLVPLAARRADRVIAVSEATAADIRQQLHVRSVDVVPNGVDLPGPVTTPGPELRARLEIGERRVILCLAAKRPHKNLLRLIEAAATLDGAVLVIAGYPTDHEEELRAVANPDRVRLLGWVDDADREGLYGIASVFAFPSLYEGFGLPVLEAMVRGVPVVCSSTPALAEVAGDAALQVDPLDAAALATALGRVLGDPHEADRLRAAGRERATRFSWDRAAQLTLDVYRRA